jgi:hypothetical protein
MTWWWLSFCDDSRPKGQQFLGACIVGPADSEMHAHMLACAYDCNPGGEIVFQPIPDDRMPRVVDSERNILLPDRSDALAMLTRLEAP